MKYSHVEEIGSGDFPTIGILGLCHGDEIVGKLVLDYLKNDLPSKIINGRVKLIYANLPAEKANKRYIDVDLNRSFPGKIDGLLEERIAYELRPVISSCSYLLDIHSTSEWDEPFVVSTIGQTTDKTREIYAGTDIDVRTRVEVDHMYIDQLAQHTGLNLHVVMDSTVASGGSLIEYVNAHGRGYAISFESGQHKDPNALSTALGAIYNVLKIHKFIDGEPNRINRQECFLGGEFIDLPVVPSAFIPSNLKNFELLPAGTPYGRDLTGKEYSLNQDCYVILFSKKLTNNKVFLRANKIL